MEAPLQLALMQKLRSIFESARTFVAFPTVPISFPAESFPAINLGASNAEELTLVSTWCRLVNLVPTGDLLLQPDQSLLWNVLDDVLRSPTEIADGTLTAAEQLKKQQAEAVLYHADGPSDKLVAYNQYRDIWLAANQALRHVKEQQGDEDDGDDEGIAHWVLMQVGHQIKNLH